MEDLTGQRFGKLTVIECLGTKEDGRRHWLCRCDCGNTIEDYTHHIKARKSCGCMLKEGYNRKHGGARNGNSERLYSVWLNIKNRCNNPRCHAYKDYGGRGIKVCPEWEHDYGAFREWALASGYDKDAATHACTIDRIDNDKGYSPDNCRWADAHTQSLNRRKRKPYKWSKKRERTIQT